MELSRSEVQLETIVRRILDDELDLQPEFQRGEVWDGRRRQRLIDSILREWYVPAVHLVKTADTEVVLDGQQRLAAIRDFFLDKIKVDGTIEPYNERILELNGLTFSRLPPPVSRAVKRFALPVITLRQFDPQEPNELFFRLNQSYNLTPPEKRNALHGLARDQVKGVVRHLTGAGLLQSEVVGFSNGRLAYDDIIARTCLALEQRDLSRHINNSVVERFYRDSEFSPQTLASVERSGLDLLAMVQQYSDRARFNKATLFSWLIYCTWAPVWLEGPLPSALFRQFESMRTTIKRRDGEKLRAMDSGLVSAIALFDDRASYRVTDVSSVLARDVVLHLFLERVHGAPAIAGSDRLLDQLSGQGESGGQAAILQFVEEGKWAQVLPSALQGEDV